MNETHASDDIGHCECGLVYAHGDPDDEEQHAVIHAQYFSGPALQAIGLTPALGRIGELSVHVIDASVPEAVRRNFARVAMAAQRSMSSYPAGYDGTVTEDDQRMYVLADGEHVVGMVISALDERFWHLAWGPNGSVQLLDEPARMKSGYKIARVWVAGAYRKRGLAKDLVKLVLAHLAADPSTIGWEMPFTVKGAALMRSLCPTEFYGCGDRHSLFEVLGSV